MAAEILIVDDEADIRDVVAGILEDEGHRTHTAKNSDEALALIETRRPHLVFLDIWMQGSKLDGLQLLQHIKVQEPKLMVVMISGHGNIETAVEAIKLGAYDFIEKPFKADRLILVAERALEASRLKREVADLKQRAVLPSLMVGHSHIINQLRQTLEKIAPTNSRVLLSGPPGAGKELAARIIHDNSPRAQNPFVTLNAATISPDAMEEKLFGMDTPSRRTRRSGALEEAHGGTLYLDEIGDMPLETQGRILRVLTEQNFQRVGGSTRIQVDVRVISSTSADLEAAIRQKRFREDLFHRLAVVPVRVPALSERREDIPELIFFFVAQMVASQGLPERKIANDTMALLQAHDWPGNIRQLRNTIERVLILAAGDPDSEITATMLPAEIGALLPKMPTGAGGEKMLNLPLREARELFEKEYLQAQVMRFSGNISRTAEFIGMERSALHRKLKSLGID